MDFGPCRQPLLCGSFPPRVPRALAIFNGGNALPTVVAAPLGSYLGSVIGWRDAFFCLVPVALIALAWQAISLPSMPAQRRWAGSGNAFKLLKNGGVSRSGLCLDQPLVA